MILRAELRKITRERLKDARALVNAGRYEGAMYLGGYVVELALKERICRTLRWSGFPQTAGEFQNFRSFRTHNLDVLLILSGVEDRIKARYFSEWTAVASWNPEMRHNVVAGTTRADAERRVRAAGTLLRVL